MSPSVAAEKPVVAGAKILPLVAVEAAVVVAAASAWA
jgi:hypothetical protein